MGDPVGKPPSTRPPPPPPGPNQGDAAAETAQQMAREAQKQSQQQQSKDAAQEGAEKAQESHAAKQADWAQHFRGLKEKTMAQMAELAEVFEMVLQEGGEGYEVSNAERGAGVFAQDHGKGFTGDEQKVVREALKQLQQLVDEHGMDLPDALRFFRAQNGGRLWQQLAQVLQKGQPGRMAGTEGMTMEELAAKLKAAGKLGQAGTLGEGDAGPEAVRNPATALAEIIRAETNPKVHMEAMLAALAILKQEGMEKSHRELMKYLRTRWGMSEKELHGFLKKYPVSYWQGPLPPQEKEKRVNAPWYPLIALGSIPIAKLLGLDWILAVFSGVLLTVVLFVVAYLSREAN